MGVRVECQVVEIEQVRCCRRADPAQDRARSEHEFVDAEGFCQIVVAAGEEALDSIIGVSPRGQEEHWRECSLLAPTATDLEPVDAGKHHVEDDEVVGRTKTLRQALAAVVDLGDRVALVTQRRRDDVADRWLVLDDQDPHGGGARRLFGHPSIVEARPVSSL